MTHWALWGTLVDTAAIIVGALLGLGIRALTMRKQRVSTMEDGFFDVPPSKAQRVVDTAKKGLGLCVILIGISGALEIELIPLMIVSIVPEPSTSITPYASAPNTSVAWTSRM